MKGVSYLGISLSIEVRFFGILRQITGQVSIKIPTKSSKENLWTVSSILKVLAKQYPKLEKEILSNDGESINPIYRLLLNSKEITFKAPLSQSVQAGDILQFFPPVSGGTIRFNQLVL